MEAKEQVTQKPNSRMAAIESEQDVIDLVELFFRLLEKAKYIVAVALLGAILMAVYTIQFVTPMYETTSKIYVLNSKDSAISMADLQIGSNLTNDYKEVFNNWHVHEMVIANLDLPYSYEQMQKMIRITNPTDTRIMYITVTNSDPQLCTDIANEYARVAREFIAIKMETDQPTIFEEALTPVKPVSPNKTKNVMLGFMAGFVLCAGIVVVQFLMDDRIHSGEDVEKYADMACLGVMPMREKAANTGKKKKTQGRKKGEGK